MKKLLSVLTVIALLVSVVPMGAFSITASAETYGNYTYRIENGEAYISKVNQNIQGDITVPSTLGGYPVTSIGDWSFYQCDRLVSVTIPDGVKEIGSHAFYTCDNLVSVSIPESVTTMYDSVFSHCIRLTSIVIPDGVGSIGKFTFKECTSLETAFIGESVVSLGDYAFDSCKNLTTIALPASLLDVGDWVFYDCSKITDVYYSGSRQSSYNIAFKEKNEYCIDATWHYGYKNVLSYTLNKQNLTASVTDCLLSATQIEIPQKIADKGKVYTVTSIGDEAFKYCDDLSTITIPDTVTSIGKSAFCDCSSLGSISIPKSVTSIGQGAFYGCGGLTAINVHMNNDSYRSDNGVLFNRSMSEIICYPAGKTSTNYEIPSGTTKIGEGAFYNCDSLINVTIPSSVDVIEDSAFYDCDSLTHMTIPDGVTDIGNKAFWGCEELIRVTIAASVTSIGQETFKDCNDLVIHGYADSYAKTYADQNEIPFVAITEDDDDQGGNQGGNEGGNEDNDTDKEQYVTWDNVTVSETGVYDIIVSYDNTADRNEIANIQGPIAVIYDKNGNAIKYNSEKRGYPLVSGENYTVVAYNFVIRYSLFRRSYTIFPDTSKTAWYNDAVTYAVGAGIMSGYNNGNFGTSDSIQRQDFLVMLARLDGVELEEYNYDCWKFSDVGRNSYYEAAVNWGAANGIVTGYQNGKFGVGDKVTREQLVTFLYRYADYKGYDSSYSSNRQNIVSSRYRDYKNVSSFAKSPVLWALEKGVISGKTNTTIVPQGNAQRCEVAKIMYNIYLNDVFKSE